MIKTEKKNLQILKFYSPLLIFFTLFVALAFTSILFYSKYEKSVYSDYAAKTAQLISKQLSVIFSAPFAEKSEISLIKDILISIINCDKNVMLIQLADKQGKIIVSEKSQWYNAQNFDGIKVSTPLNASINGQMETIAYVHVSISKKYNNKIISAFSVIFLAIYFLIAILIFLVLFFIKIVKQKEFSIFKIGLKNLLNGKFGVELNYVGSKQANEIVSLLNYLSVKLKDYEEQNVDNILLERNKLEAILMGILNGVVVCDNNDDVVLINASAEKILSVSSDTILNVPIQRFCDNSGHYSFRDKIEEFKDIPLELILKNPPEYTLNVNDKIIKCIISPMFMKNDDYVGYIMVLTDITRETEVNNMKNQFISNVSHELRTPVTVLRTYLDTLNTMSDELDEDTKKEFIATADKEVARLHRMVNDILDVSRLESPNVELEKETENIFPVLQDTIASMQVLANEKHVKISLEKLNEISDIPFNKASMERVFNNLLSNAIKYSPQNGKIVVKIKEDDTFVDISVKDEGTGIEAKHLPKLFDRFYRAENNVHTVKGTGLGLYLVKTTVEKHHSGKVYVESTIGVGSTFGIKLPIS